MSGGFFLCKHYEKTYLFNIDKEKEWIFYLFVIN